MARAMSAITRSIAKRAEAYLKSSGLGDAAFFGPEPEFFIFDSVRWGDDMSGSFCKIESSEASWSSGEKMEGGNPGHRLQRLKAVTSRFLPLIAFMTCVPKCA